MKAETREMKEIAPPSHALEIAEHEVIRLARLGTDRRVEGPVRAAIAEARYRVAPRARWREVDDGDEGLFPSPTPVEAIARSRQRWIFAATIGSALEERVRDHFAEGRYLEAVILDAAGSVAVEAVCDLVERSCAEARPSARFSPGYCMWRLEAQRKLFDFLDPEEIGIRLMPSMLMHPLKSVTGLVVQARAREELAVPREQCAPCDAVGCVRRAAGAG